MIIAQKKYGKIYVDPEEDTKRYTRYMNEMANIYHQNEKYFKENTEFILGENQYSDWFEDEINAIQGFCLNERQKLVSTEWKYYKAR